MPEWGTSGSDLDSGEGHLEAAGVGSGDRLMRALADIEAALDAAYAQRRAIFESNESRSLDGIKYSNRLEP